MDSLFQFHANAAAASGVITLPFKEQIPVVASCSLPPTGGYGSARVNDFKHREILTMREAYCFVTGSVSPSDKSAQTSTTVVVTGLNILDVVTADRIVARLTSEKREDSGEVSIIPTGSTFENLRIAGRRVRAAELLETRLFSVFDEFGDIFGQSKSSDASRAERVDKWRPRLQSHLSDVLLLNHEGELHPRLRKYFPHHGKKEMPRQDSLSCSLAPNLESRVRDHDAAGHAIYVKGFGVIRLAELQISPSRRRLTMLSVDLGCAFEGRVSACYAESNGSIWG